MARPPLPRSTSITSFQRCSGPALHSLSPAAPAPNVERRLHDRQRARYAVSLLGRARSRERGGSPRWFPLGLGIANEDRRSLPQWLSKVCRSPINSGGTARPPLRTRRTRRRACSAGPTSLPSPGLTRSLSPRPMTAADYEKYSNLAMEMLHERLERLVEEYSPEGANGWEVEYSVSPCQVVA